MAKPVATFWWSAVWEDPSVGYEVASDWMITVPSRHLPAVLRCHERDSLKRDQEGETAIFICPELSADIEAIEEARKLGYRVLVAVDQNGLWKDRTTVYVPGTGGERVAHAVATASRENHRRAVQLADGVIIQTDALRRHYAPLGTPVHVIPQAIDPAEWPALRKPKDGIFRVGFAAAPHVARRLDLELLEPALEWASAQPGVEAVLFGINPLLHTHPDDGPPGSRIWTSPSRRLEWLARAEERRARWRFPTTCWEFTGDAYRYREALQWFDVGLAPSDPRNVERSPTDTKLIDYAMAGAYPIASNCPPYDEWGELVRLAPSSDAFLEAVQWAVAHRDEVCERALRAREYVLRERTIEATLPLWRAAVAGA